MGFIRNFARPLAEVLLPIHPGIIGTLPRPTIRCSTSLGKTPELTQHGQVNASPLRPNGKRPPAALIHDSTPGETSSAQEQPIFVDLKTGGNTLRLWVPLLSM